MNPNVWTFNSDAINMYGNIGIEEGIRTIQDYVRLFAGEYKGHFLSKLIIKLLHLVISENIFKFGNTWWLQKVGTEMGTPCATSYVIIFFAFYERTGIFPRFKNNLLFYVIFIDDIFGVWENPSSDSNDSNDFKQYLNSLSSLTWKTENLSTCTTFLDITINLNRQKGEFLCTTLQKPMNLFLYIFEHSAHPPGLIVSILYSLLKTYWYQNTKQKDYIKMARLLFNRLTSKGFKTDPLSIIFLEAATKIENSLHSSFSITPLEDKISFKNQLFFHIPYHQRDIPRLRIRNEYENICEPQDESGNSFRN